MFAPSIVVSSKAISGQHCLQGASLVRDDVDLASVIDDLDSGVIEKVILLQQGSLIDQTADMFRLICCEEMEGGNKEV